MNMKNWKRFWTLNRHHAEGFTLVELIVVIAILAILAGIAVPAYSGYVDKAKMAADQQLLATMNTAFTVACMDNKEYDMTNLSFSPVASNIQTNVAVNKYNTEFQGYFGGGAFQYYDVLRFDSSKGVFVANTVAAIKEALKNAWEGSTFGAAADGGEGVLKTLLGAFDGISGYFGDMGWSFDDFFKGKPQSFVDMFGFGQFDVTDVELDSYLEKYYEDYAALDETGRAEWRAKAENEGKIDTIIGNASVLHFANDATGRSAETILTNVDKFVAAINRETTPEEDQAAVIAYYKKINGIADNVEVSYSEADNALSLGYGIDSALVVAMANSGATNTAGVSTLGSMYALAAGYFNSGYFEKSEAYGAMTDEELELFGNPNYSNFDAFMTAAQMDNFAQYCQEKGMQDVNAYLDFMDYLSAENVDMTNGNAFMGANTDILEILGLAKKS